MSLEEMKARLPEEMHFVLANCDALTVYALHPDDSRAAEYDELFHGYAALGETQVQAAPVKRKVIASLYQGMADDDAMQMLCFIPRHGVRAVHGSRVVDLVLCYQCGNMRIYLGSDPIPLHWSICGPSQWLLNELLSSSAST